MQTTGNRVIVTTTDTAVVLVMDCGYTPLLETLVEVVFTPKLALRGFTDYRSVTTGSGEQLELYLL